MLAIPESGPTRSADSSGTEETDSKDPRLEAVDVIATQVMRTMRLTHLAMHALGKEPEGKDIDAVAFRVLARLVTAGPARLTALAEALHSDASTMSRQTSALVKAGLLERRPDAADGRASLLAATEQGTELYERFRKHRDTRLAGVLSDWPDDEVRQLARLLERYNAALEHHYVPEHCAEPKTVGPRAHTDWRAHVNDQDMTEEEGEGKA